LPSIEDITPKFIHLNIGSIGASIKKIKKLRKGPIKVHEGRDAINKKYGDYAEKIVMKYEKSRLLSKKMFKEAGLVK